MIEGAKKADRSQEKIELAADSPAEESAAGSAEESGYEGELKSDHSSEKGDIEVFGSDENNSSGFAADDIQGRT
jgi:hypothetical protein